MGNEIGESAAMGNDAISIDECPMAPHKETKKFKAKAPKVKSVPELRSNMKKGVSTQTWEDNGTEVVEGTNETAERPLPTVSGDEPPIQIGDRGYPLSIAAHHLIPGKDSLPESNIKKFVWATYNVIKNDIGYDVDGAENGVWLPTHQALSAGLGKAKTIVIQDDTHPEPTGPGMSYRQLSKRAKAPKENELELSTTKFIPTYTQLAMKELDAQFHDSHKPYSLKVIDRLDKYAVALNDKVGYCDECSKKGEPFSPPHGLVFILNSVSQYYQGKLKGPPTSWDREIYTSDWSLHYMSTSVID